MIVRFLAVWLFTSGIVGLMIYFFSSKERSEIYKVVKKIAWASGIALLTLLVAIFGLNNISGL